MKLLTFSQGTGVPRPGILLEDQVIPLPYPNMLAVIQAGQAVWDALRETAQGRGASSEQPLPLESLRLHPPIPRPPSLRDFYAFEQHVATANANRGRPVPPAWYEMPVFYFSNPAATFGPNAVIYPPKTSQALDYELEVACIIGKKGRDISPQNSQAYIFGYTIFNDWSARDIQKKEMSVGLGPAKSKDFASSFGPFIITPEELEDRQTGRSGVYNLLMSARINGEERSKGSWTDLYYSFGEIIAHASADVVLQPGDIIGSGTVGTGCLLELTKGEGPWLQPGDIVELTIERLGVLRNRVGDRSRLEGINAV